MDFVDLPGYGFAQVSKSEKKRWQELIDGYFIQDRKHALCVLLVDLRHDVSKLDIQMAEFLKAHEIPFIIAFTKADKVGTTKQRGQVKTLCRQLAVAGDTYVVMCSSVTGAGMDDLKALIADALAQASAPAPKGAPESGAEAEADVEPEAEPAFEFEFESESGQPSA